MAGVSENLKKAQLVEFTVFTTSLVSNTFATLLSNQASQIAAYSEMLAEIAKTLTDYINDTKDDITAEELFAFVKAYVANVDDDNQPITSATTQELTNLNKALVVTQDEVNQLSVNPAAEDPTVVKTNPGITTSSTVEELKEVIINRLSVNKYQYLKEIVQTGLVRLVVDNGIIETSLDFKTSEYLTYREKSSSYTVTNQSYGISGRGSFFGGMLNIAAGAGYSRLDVQMSDSNKFNAENTEVSISGRVKINFASDYKPLTEVN